MKRNSILITSFCVLALIASCAIERAQIFDYFILKPSTLPVGGTQGEFRVDASVNQLKKFNTDNSVWELIAGAGGGGINFIEKTKTDSFNLEGTIGDWIAYEDTGDGVPDDTQPFDGTGGSPTITCTRNASGTILHENGELQILKDSSDRQGEGCSVNFTINDNDAFKGKVFQTTFLWDGKTDTDYANGDVKLFFFDRDNSTLITPEVIEATDNQLPATAGMIHVIWQTVSNANDYRLILHQSTTNAAAVTTKGDEFKAGLRELVVGDNLSGQISFTPTGTITTNATYTGSYSIVGNKIDVYSEFTLSGVNTQGTVEFDLPSPFTMDASAILTATVNNHGMEVSGYALDDSSRAFPINLIYVDSNTLRATTHTDDDGQTSNHVALPTAVSTSSEAPFAAAWASGDQVWIHYTVPVNELSPTAVLTNSRVEYACNTDTTDAADTTSFSNSSEGCVLPSAALTANRFKRIRFQNAIQPTDHYWIELDQAGTGQFEKISRDMVAGVGGTLVTSFIFQASATYGFGQLFNVSGSTTDIDVRLGQYKAPGATYGGAGSAWNASTGEAKWRMVKAANPLAVEESQYRTYGFKVNCDSASSITQDSRNAVSSIGNVSAGLCVITLNAIFNTTPICTHADADAVSPNHFIALDPTTTTNINMDCDADGGTDCTAYNVHIMCWEN